VLQLGNGFPKMMHPSLPDVYEGKTLTDLMNLMGEFAWINEWIV
jgi:hypothetical protein